MPDSLATNAEAPGQILASSPQINVVLDRDGLIRYPIRVEPGHEMAQVLGTRAEDLFAGERRARFIEALKAALQAGTEASVEIQMPKPDGTFAWYRSESQLS